MTAPWPIDRADVLSQVRHIVWEHEGAKRGDGPTVHPKDLGGRTRAGLTWRTYSAWLGLPVGELCPVATFDGLVLDAIVQVLADVFAMQSRFWAIRDARLRFIAIDTAVLFGVPRATEFLQTAVGGLAVDGLFGRQTEGALARFPDVDVLRERVIDLRNQRHATRVVERPDQLAFLVGWIRRSGRAMAWRPARDPQ